ncbi:MAG: RNA polymerase factor sigma-54, partial [Omnitrophica bacterium]|nr:RNA polymerase factor sigma-54 [Candidatus Omnitrophota bacterium]
CNFRSGICCILSYTKGKQMSLQQKLTLKLTQRLALTPKMRQSLYILQLPLMELKRFLQEKMVENPLLEEAENVQEKDEPTDSEELIESILRETQQEYFDSDNDNTSYSQEIQKKQNFKESLARYVPSLQENLLQQLSLSTASSSDYKIGQFIIGNIDENGYLQCSVEEIQEILGVSKKDSLQALRLIQSFDPPGVGAQNLKDCLVIQLKQKNKQDSLSSKIVSNYLTDLEKKRYDHLARVFKVPLEKIEQAVKEISSLEPKPGRPFASSNNTYIRPDIILQKQKENYEIILNDEELPTLQVSPQYRRLLQDAKVAKDTKQYLKSQLNSAVWLIKAVAQRQSTLLKVARLLIETQKDFLDKGERYLLPLTVEQIAKAIKRDKSTVSRVLANKYMQTQFGVFALRDLLSQGIKLSKGEVISSKNVKAQIEDLIKAENPKHPLTDEKIVEILKKREILLARRTCAKYREQLKILPSSLRKRSLTN